MSKGHVAMLLTNGYEPDRRVQKEARTLAAAGWRVTIIAWDRTGELPEHEVEHERVAVVRIRVRAGYGTGRELLPRMLLFWWRALHELRTGEYAINPPGVWHTADVESEATALFITAGLGTELRPR